MEVRTAAPDDVWLSTAHSSPRVCIAVDEFFAQEHDPYFEPEQTLFGSGGHLRRVLGR